MTDSKVFYRIEVPGVFVYWMGCGATDHRYPINQAIARVRSRSSSGSSNLERRKIDPTYTHRSNQFMASKYELFKVTRHEIKDCSISLKLLTQELNLQELFISADKPYVSQSSVSSRIFKYRKEAGLIIPKEPDYI